MQRHLGRFGLVLICLFPGCNVILDLLNLPGNQNPPGGNTAAPELRKFASEQELTDYFSQQIMVRNGDLGSPAVPQVDATENVAADGDAGGSAPTAAPTDGGGAGDGGGGRDDFSDTTIQEQGVDEADVVKTDGDYIYIIRNDYTNTESFGSLQIVSTADPLARAAELRLEGYGRELYLRGDTIVALTETYGNYFFFGGGIADGVLVSTDVMATDGTSSSDGTTTEPGTGVDGVANDVDNADVGNVDDGSVGDVDDGAVGDDSSILPPDDSYQYERPRTIVTVIDASDRANPRMLSRTSFDGSQSSSRMIDGVLHMVIANYQNYYFDVFPALGRPQLDVGGVDAESLLPHYTRTNADGTETSGMALTWEDVYHPAEPDGFGVVTLVSLNVDADAAFTAIGVVAEPGLIYSSRDALYLSNTNYDFQGNMRTTTDLYKFRYAAGSADLTSVGRVPGRVLNQYSMGEHNGFLRVATTVDATFDFNGVSTEAHNNVYVLGDSAGALGVVGSVENIAPRETIQSARFLGDRGYVVTFEQIDPLFTLDLADPTNPRIVGELKVPGFSTFILPMDANHLLAVGQYIPDQSDDSFFRPWGVQLSIFDVTDFANPVLQHSAIIGDATGAYSEALYNPKALTYFAEDGTDGAMVALPISIYDNSYVIFDDVIPPDVTDADGGGSSDGGVVSEPPAVDPAQSTETDETTVVDSGDGGTTPEDEPVVPIIEPYVPGGFEGIKVYHISAQTGFTEMGDVSTRFEDAGYYYASFSRGVFIGDDVFAVSDNGVRSMSLSDPTKRGELLLREPIPAEPIPVADNTEAGSGGVAEGVDGVNAAAVK